MQVIKRDGSKVKFDSKKIYNAIEKAMVEVNDTYDSEVINKIVDGICKNIKNGTTEATVESIQDEVELALMASGKLKVARAYILYREERNKQRGIPDKYKYLTNEFLKPYRSKKDSFTTELGKMVYKRTYSRPIPEEHRREDWWETVARVVDYSTDLEVIARRKQGLTITQEKHDELLQTAKKMYDHIFNLGLFPSGRSLWVGGTKSSYQYPLSNFNCSFLTIDEFEKFSEMFFVLMLGTGVGLSVEREYIEQMPKVNTNIRVIHKDYTPVPRPNRLEYTELEQPAHNVLKLNVGDSKYGWSKAMEMYFDIVTNKQYADIEFILINYDNVRPKGEPLKTFGGFASGHGNLKTMFDKIDKLIEKMNNDWEQIKPIHALDIATIIAENVISGGVRRSALIVFTDEDEDEVIKAKSNLYTQLDGGEWVENKEILHRSLSNNTVKYYKKPSREALEKHVETMRFTGEPGFDNMEQAIKRREDAVGFNPCNEIILRDRGVCNLTEINMVNYVDENGLVDFDGLYESQKLSAIIGYRMATIELEIHKWDVVNREDRLVGCSLTGITDFMQKANLSYSDMKPILTKLRKIAQDTAIGLANDLGMNEPKLVTTIKPSGTVSQLPTVSSGLHFNHSKYYIRRVRVNADDPIAIALSEDGFKWSPEVGQTKENHTTKVFEFPVKTAGKIFKGDVSAIEQLEWYKLIMEYYVDHNASITVHVRDNEWEDVTDWLYDNWDSVVGISFLPYDGGVYKLAPYESITKEEYIKMLENTPKFRPETLNKHERFEEEFDILDTECDTGFCPIR